MRAPSKYVRIIQHTTVATYRYMVNGYQLRTETKHHEMPPDPPVYMRKGREECIRRFRSKAAATR